MAYYVANKTVAHKTVASKTVARKTVASRPWPERGAWAAITRRDGALIAQ